ncbi:MAG: nitroreductase [Pseudomonadota bacterium]
METSKGLNTLVRERRSVRAYLSRPVDKQTILQILDLARQTASGGNMQPWQVHVLHSETIAKLHHEISDEVEKNGFGSDGDYQYYPTASVEPYDERIKQSGLDLYSSLSIGPRDTARKRQQKLRNFEFYGAPVGLLITMDRKLAQGSWIDIGLFLNMLTLAISDAGLACCTQASFSSYGDIIRRTLKLSSDSLIICGVALGYEDKTDPINALPRRRKALEDFVEFHP